MEKCSPSMTPWDTVPIIVDTSTAYISYSSAKCASWRLDDGSQLPNEKYFENIEYDRKERRFRALIDWSPTSFCGDQLWEYDIVFDEAFTCVLKGEVRHYTPDLSDRDSSQQVLYFKCPSTCTDPFTLRYSRYLDDDASSTDDLPSRSSSTTSLPYEPRVESQDFIDAASQDACDVQFELSIEPTDDVQLEL